MSHSFLANDPRVRRCVSALLDDDWYVEGLFLDHPVQEEKLRTWRVPIRRKQGGILRYAFEYGAFFFWMFGWVLFRALRHRPDVVYVNSPPDAFTLAALPAKLFGGRTILDIHDPMPELFTAKGRTSGLIGVALKFQERVGVAAVDALITVHEPLAGVINERLPNAEFAIVMNVPDTNISGPGGWPEHERDPESRLLVYTGTVANRYGLDDLIGAVGLVQKEIPAVMLKIVGDGEDLESLRLLVAELGLGERVEFVGRVRYDEIRSHLDGAWLGVNVPKPDDLGELSFSNKVVESVSIGLPVLAARTSTMERYFSEGTLFYTSGGDVASIVETLKEIDKMSPERVASQVEAAKDALNKIAWPVQRENLLSVVNRMAAS